MDQEEKAGLVIVGGIALTGIVVWALTRNAYAAPPAQVPTPSTAPEQVATGVALTPGAAAAITVPVDQTNTDVLVSIPAGGTWGSLVNPNGSAVPVSGGDAVTIPVIAGVWTAKWTDATGAQTATLNVTTKLPPSGA